MQQGAGTKQQAIALQAPFMTGEKVYIRGLDREDLLAMVPWINDDDVVHLLFTGDRPANAERLADQWERSRDSTEEIAFAACCRQTGQFIGTTGLYRVHWVMRSAEFRVFLGDKTYWNKGIGTELTKMMVVYGFERLNMNRIWLGVNADNIGGVRAYEKAGFMREGVLRQEQYRNFRYYDVIRMGLLRTEYDQMRDGYLQREREA
jgi:[ribosomal protein S5]-alanine N-acetyltransferase